MMKANRWFPFGVHPDAQVRLLCLPHAGAGASLFDHWGKGFPPHIKACPVQPPGREKRIQEQPFTRVQPLARELAQEIASCVREPFALFGHSTGALCAFETARELRRIDGPRPLHIFVSGRRAPHIPMERHNLSAMSVAELSGMLRTLGGTPEEILDDPDVLGFLQPLLAADFSVNEDYTYSPQEALDIPLTAFCGVDDDGADVVSMEPWEAQTSAAFRLHALDGGHFAILDRVTEVHSAISEALPDSRKSSDVIHGKVSASGSAPTRTPSSPVSR